MGFFCQHHYFAPFQPLFVYHSMRFRSLCSSCSVCLFFPLFPSVFLFILSAICSQAAVRVSIDARQETAKLCLSVSASICLFIWLFFSVCLSVNPPSSSLSFFLLVLLTSQAAIKASTDAREEIDQLLRTKAQLEATIATVRKEAGGWVSMDGCSPSSARFPNVLQCHFSCASRWRVLISVHPVYSLASLVLPLFIL